MTATGRDRVVLLSPEDHWRASQVPPGLGVARAHERRFPDGERVLSVPDAGLLAGSDVLVVQTTCQPQAERYLAFLQAVDVARRAGAARVWGCCPYLCYQRQDRATSHGEAVTGPLVAAIAQTLGVRGLFAADTHNASTPLVTDIGTASAFANHARATRLRVDVVVAPDAGGAPRASAVARELSKPVVILDKHKDGARTWYERVPHGLTGAHCLVIDDLASSGSTLRPVLDLIGSDAAAVSVYVTHLLAGREALLANLSDVDKLVYSDSCGDARAAIAVLPLVLQRWCDMSAGTSARLPRRPGPDGPGRKGDPI